MRRPEPVSASGNGGGTSDPSNAAAIRDSSEDSSVRGSPSTGRVGDVGAAACSSDTVARISNYRRVVGSLGISQTPAMVVIDKNRNARLFEGYLDAGTIRQSVTDAG